MFIVLSNCYICNYYVTFNCWYVYYLKIQQVNTTIETTTKINSRQTNDRKKNKENVSRDHETFKEPETLVYSKKNK